jgi:type II secretory pathway pseudopilin PulG
MKQLDYFRTGHLSGFSLVELLIYMAVLAVLMTAVFISYTRTLKNSAQQTSVAETKIETNLGLELLRMDLEHAGFGLPWRLSGASYTEPTPLDDAPNIPRAIVSEDLSVNSMNRSDYLVIRASNAIRGVSGKKWGYVGRNDLHETFVQSVSDDGFLTGDVVIVIRPEIEPGQFRELVVDDNNFTTKITNSGKSLSDSFAPPADSIDPEGMKYLVYGLANTNDIQRPFNRTDYYISAGAIVPTHCAPNTGGLVKAIANQNIQAPNSQDFSSTAIVDCVADFQIVYYLGTNNVVSNASSLAGLSAKEIREQVRAIRFFVLTHEGGMDRSYTYPNTTVNVGVVDSDGNLVGGRPFDLKERIGESYINYRWKVESMMVTPKNLQ